MGIEAPLLSDTIGLLIGMQWPAGDEDQMWQLAQDWRDAANSLSDIDSDIDAAISAVQAAYPDGSGGEAMIAQLQKMRSGPQSIDQLVKWFNGVADSAEGAGDQIEASKIMFSVVLVVTAAELAVEWAFPPTAPEEEAVTVAAGRVTMRIAMKQLVKKLLYEGLKNAALKFLKSEWKKLLFDFIKSAVLPTVVDLGTQEYQVLEGHRSHVDWGEVGTTLATSAAGFALGGMAGGLAGSLMKEMGVLTGKGLQGMTRTAIGGLAGGLGGYAGNGLVTNNWQLDPRMLTSGVLMGGLHEHIQENPRGGEGLGSSGLKDPEVSLPDTSDGSTPRPRAGLPDEPAASGTTPAPPDSTGPQEHSPTGQDGTPDAQSGTDGPKGTEGGTTPQAADTPRPGESQPDDSRAGSSQPTDSRSTPAVSDDGPRPSDSSPYRNPTSGETSSARTDSTSVPPEQPRPVRAGLSGDRADTPGLTGNRDGSAAPVAARSTGVEAPRTGDGAPRAGEPGVRAGAPTTRPGEPEARPGDQGMRDGAPGAGDRPREFAGAAPRGDDAPRPDVRPGDDVGDRDGRPTDDRRKPGDDEPGPPGSSTRLPQDPRESREPQKDSQDQQHRPDDDQPHPPEAPVPEDRPSIEDAFEQHAEQTPAGLSLHRGDPDMGDLPSRVPPDHRYFTADAHVTPDGHIKIGDHLYTPEEFGDMLRAHGWDGEKPIRLIGCGASENGAAGRLADHLDTDVLAPTEKAWTDEKGRVYSSSSEPGLDGNRRPRIPPDGEWETSHPDGTKTRASEDGFVPGSGMEDKHGLTGDDASPRAAQPGDREQPTHRGSVESQIDSALADHPRVADVVGQLVADSAHPLDLTRALADPNRRAVALRIVSELSEGRLLQDRELAEYLRDNPGRGPLFEPIPKEVNEGADGRSRLSKDVELSKEIDPARAAGPDPDAAQRNSMVDYAQRLAEGVEPAVRAELEHLIVGLDGANTNVRTKDARGILDKVQRMVRGHEGRAPRPYYEAGDVIDAVGARITVENTQQLGRLLERVQRYYGTGEGGRILEIENMYAAPKSGSPEYRVIPVVIRIEVAGIPYTYELQLTTRRASVAADLYHNTIYKQYAELTSEQREKIQRMFAEAAALDQQECAHRGSQ